MADYPGAIDYFVDASRVFVNQNSHKAIVLHGCGGNNPDQTAQQLGDYFRTNTLITSVHYGIDRQGVICQYVREQDGAGGNCCVEPGHDTFWDQFNGDNLNRHTISIEHENNLTNSLPLTPAQQTASFKLVAYLSKKYNIPASNIKSHASIAPKTRQECPGNYPWDALWTYLKGQSTPVSTPTTHGKEVCTFEDADQFQPAKSQGECGCFSVALCKAMAPIGHTPAQTVPQVIAEAENWYQQIVGDNSINTYVGLDDKQIMALLAQNGLPSTAIDPHAVSIQTKVAQGYPVIVCVTETSVVDMALGRNPYPWQPAGNHIFVVTGIRDDGNFLVRDSANCTNLYDPNSLRPGPRSYTMGMEKLWAIAVTPHWLTQQEAQVTITLAQVSQFFVDGGSGTWLCKNTNKYIKGAILRFYQDFGNAGLCGLTFLGLPITEELAVSTAHPEVKVQQYERGILAYDPNHIIDSVPGGGDVYLLHLDKGAGQQIIAQPVVSPLQQQIADLKNQLAADSNVNVTLLQQQITSLQGKINQAKTALN